MTTSNALSADALQEDFNATIAHEQRTERAGRMNSLTVLVEARAGATAEVHPVTAATLRRLVKDRIGVTVQVDVVAPAALERSIGKARRLIDNRPS